MAVHWICRLIWWGINLFITSSSWAVSSHFIPTSISGSWLLIFYLLVLSILVELIHKCWVHKTALYATSVGLSPWILSSQGNCSCIISGMSGIYFSDSEFSLVQILSLIVQIQILSVTEVVLALYIFFWEINHTNIHKLLPKNKKG